MVLPHFVPLAQLSPTANRSSQKRSEPSKESNDISEEVIWQLTALIATSKEPFPKRIGTMCGIAIELLDYSYTSIGSGESVTCRSSLEMCYLPLSRQKELASCFPRFFFVTLVLRKKGRQRGTPLYPVASLNLKKLTNHLHLNTCAYETNVIYFGVIECFSAFAICSTCANR